MRIDYFGRIYDFLQKRRLLVAYLIIAVILASVIGLRLVQYNNDIGLMLPQDKKVQRSMQFLREANFSDKLVISLKLEDPNRSSEDLISTADQFSRSLKSPLIKQVIANVSGNNLISEVIFFLEYTPELLNQESLLKIDKQFNPQGIKERLGFIYRQSLAPGSSFMMPFLRADPLGASNLVLRNIEKLSTSLGYDVIVRNGFLLSRDERNSMVIIKTSVPLTEGFGSRKLISYLTGKFESLPKFIKPSIIAGHLHTVSNEDVIKRDILVTSCVALLAASNSSP